ncbi:hypothetical protein [Bdellovibrio sp. HCB2-146]|uniref:hypothetical protein n=1 Tax=Bdellovibrio sp. HCB2-146 TaxID=3394362 RepID=UPI0039BD7481
MKALVLSLTFLVMGSISQARELTYRCVSYHDKSEGLNFVVDTSSLFVEGQYNDVDFQGFSTGKDKPHLTFSFGDEREQKLDFHFNVKSRIASIVTNKKLEVVFQGYCY